MSTHLKIFSEPDNKVDILIGFQYFCNRCGSVEDNFSSKLMQDSLLSYILLSI